MYILKKSVLRVLLAFLFAVAFFIVLKTPFSVFAADGSSATGASLPDYSGSKEVNVVNDYGADSTGTETSAAAIQKALDVGKNEATDECKVVVRIPAGTYRLETGLRIYSNTQLIMDEGAVLMRCYNGGRVLGNITADSTVGGYEGSHNILIEGGTIDGNTSEYNSTYAFSIIRIAHANNVVIRNLTVINNKNGHHIEMGGVQAVTIEGCSFKGYTGSLLKEAIQLDVMNCEELFSGYEPFDDTACDNVIIQNCIFKDIPRAVGSHSAVAGHYYTNISIIDNTCDNITNVCFFLYNYKHCTISGNTMTSCGTGIIFNYMTDESFKHFFTPVAGLSSASSLIDSDADLVIKDNSITTQATSLQSNPTAIQLYGTNISKATSFYPAHNYTISNVKISGNTINSAGRAIYMNNVLDTVIKSNTISVNSEADKLEENLIYLTNCTNIDANDCTVKNSVKSAIRAESCSDISVSGCKISGCGDASVVLSNVSGGEISKSSVSSCSSGGIRISDGSSAVSCTGNTLKSFGAYGIEVTSSRSGEEDIKLTSNDFADGEKGISCVENGKAYLTGNSFEAVSDKVYADADGLIELGSVKNFKAEEVTENRVKLTWNAVGEADGVELYRCRTGYGEEYALLATIESGSIYQDEKLYQGTNYLYKIIPYIDIDGTSYPSTVSGEMTTRTKVNIETAYVECVSQAGFTSKPITPKFSITANSKKLVAGVDYDYEYSDNIYVGEATITIIGKGNYIGTLTYNFDIVLGGDNVYDVASREGESSVIFGVQSDRKYNVTLELTDDTVLVTDSGRQLTFPERSVEALKLQVPIKIKTTTAIWTGSGYMYFVL